LFWTVSDPDIGAFTATVFKTDGADEGAVESYVGRVMYPMEPQRKLSGREDRFFHKSLPSTLLCNWLPCDCHPDKGAFSVNGTMP
jgi:hypothetical protein